MTYQNISKAAVDAAAPLTFEDRKPVKQELTITIHARIGGFDTEVCFSGQLDQLEAITRRLRDLGASPAGVHQVSPATQAAPRKAAERVEPLYSDDGSPMCPKHKRALKAGAWGLYCSAKDDTTERGYCSLKFVE